MKKLLVILMCVAILFSLAISTGAAATTGLVIDDVQFTNDSGATVKMFVNAESAPDGTILTGNVDNNWHADPNPDPAVNPVTFEGYTPALSGNKSILTNYSANDDFIGTYSDNASVWLWGPNCANIDFLVSDVASATYLQARVKNLSTTESFCFGLGIGLRDPSAAVTDSWVMAGTKDATAIELYDLNNKKVDPAGIKGVYFPMHTNDDITDLPKGLVSIPGGFDGYIKVKLSGCVTVQFGSSDMVATDFSKAPATQKVVAPEFFYSSTTDMEKVAPSGTTAPTDSNATAAPTDANTTTKPTTPPTADAGIFGLVAMGLASAGIIIRKKK